ncbi:SAM-dependent methyltransferase [Aestuariivirga litoralis]|uniref:SAM-dependent methyltransferase n=1 Tax=Aestuariivirga litoralis TaxID=2650924 RepID=A0A2W2BJM9_9HYPH|nr:small ribosomal subunit Rsm22 family protein [Aestuariivirga litoralis]PZF76399.1 SAM-dependent methyltransferase [Aestuariivirga litoralis]
MSLPENLQAAVTAWLAAQAGSRRPGSQALSQTYRAGGTSAGVDLGSYLVARLPATFAAVDRVLAELARLRPGFAPRSLLDAGSGPGTASWAALGHWPGLDAITFLDSSPPFLALAAALARQGPAALAGATPVGGRMEDIPPGLVADLVIAAYALAELPLDRAAATAAALWRASREALVLVEPGTPQGFARLRAVRQLLLTQGAVPVAPCCHALACPMAGDDWCHFSVRLARSRAHMHAKAARVPFEDERFAYLVLARGGAPQGGGRIVAPPQQAKPGVSFRLCSEGRLETRHVARRDGAAYKWARKLDWGDLWRPATEEDAP